MSYADRTLETRAKTKLSRLMNAVQPIINEHINEMDANEVNYILTNFRKYLKIDLERDFESKRETDLKVSPFDDLLND